VCVCVCVCVCARVCRFNMALFDFRFHVPMFAGLDHRGEPYSKDVLFGDASYRKGVYNPCSLVA
jgi:hypothetical protein